MKRVYRQFPIDPKDYKYLSFQWDGFPYFDTRYSFVLRSFALICQRTTRADIHVFNLLRKVIPQIFIWMISMELSIYQTPPRLSHVFKNYHHHQSSPKKDFPPSTRMIYQGLLVDSDQMLMYLTTVCWNFIRSKSSGCNFPPSQGVNCSCYWANCHLSQLSSGREGFLCRVF